MSQRWGLAAAAAMLITIAVVAAVWLTPPPAPSTVRAIAASADGRLLAAAVRARGITVWDARTFARQAHLAVDDDAFNALALSPNGAYLASAGRSLRLWRTGQWDYAATLGAPDRHFGSVHFSPDSRTLVSGNAGERVELWDAATGARLRSLCCMALYGEAAFSPSGTLLATAGHWPALWDVASGERILRLVPQREPTFAAVAFSPDSTQLAGASQDGVIRIWNAASGQLERTSTARRAYIESLAYHASGTLIAYRTRDGEAWLWDLAANTERRIATSISSNVAFHGNALVMGHFDGSVRMWDIESRREVRRLRIP